MRLFIYLSTLDIVGLTVLFTGNMGCNYNPAIEDGKPKVCCVQYELGTNVVQTEQQYCKSVKNTLYCYNTELEVVFEHTGKHLFRTGKCPIK